MPTPILNVGQLSSSTIISAITEVVTPVTLSSNVVTLDCSLGNIFFIGTAPSAAMTFNIINAPTTINRMMTVSVFVTQGSTGYGLSSLTVNGVTATTKGSSPSATSGAGKIDVFSYTLHNTASGSLNVYVTGASNF
jgi:hypothetical protein